MGENVFPALANIWPLILAAYAYADSSAGGSGN